MTLRGDLSSPGPHIIAGRFPNTSESSLPRSCAHTCAPEAPHSAHAEQPCGESLSSPQGTIPAIETIRTLRSMLAANADPRNTRYNVLSPEEAHAVYLGVDALECEFLSIFAPVTPCAVIPFDSGSVAVGEFSEIMGDE